MEYRIAESFGLRIFHRKRILGVRFCHMANRLRKDSRSRQGSSVKPACKHSGGEGSFTVYRDQRLPVQTREVAHSATLLLAHFNELMMCTEDIGKNYNMTSRPDPGRSPAVARLLFRSSPLACNRP